MADGENDQNTLLKSVLGKVDTLTTLLSKKEDIDESKFVDMEKTLGEVSKDAEEFEKALGIKDDEIKTKDDKIVELEKTISDRDVEDAKVEHAKLVEDDIALVKKLDKDSEIKTEEDLLKSLADDFTEEEFEKDVDGVLRSDIRANKLALSRVSNGDLPIPDVGIKPNPTATSNIEKLQKKLDSQGLIGGDD
jgi:vacuolar-type H+-ATPase subunit I/STV1